MLCAHLLCFAVMFLLISKRLHGQKMGMDLFALGNFLLGSAYVLQLLEGGPAWSAMSVVNHTLTLASPVVYWLGAMRFFGHAVPLLSPLLVFAALYSLAQVLVQWSLGPVARYAMLSGGSALLFFVMALTVIYGARTFAKDLYGEMVFFAALISGLCVLNALKFMKLLDGGLDALQMDRQFQLVFYIYMSFLATVLPPSIVWLVLRRLTDQLRHIAARDPMTQLLNRRGLTEALQLSFNQRRAEHAHLLVVDVDHFKRINDTYGHHAGDTVLCRVAEILQATARRGLEYLRHAAQDGVAGVVAVGVVDPLEVVNVDNEQVRMLRPALVERQLQRLGETSPIEQLRHRVARSDMAQLIGQAAQYQPDDRWRQHRGQE